MARTTMFGGATSGYSLTGRLVNDNATDDEQQDR